MPSEKTLPATSDQSFVRVPLTFGSIFAGIGGLDLGFERAGLQCRWQVEIDEYARKVLQKHWPEVKKHDDNRTFTDIPSVDVIAGGFPCQDVGNAGHRAGINGERSGLFFELMRIVRDVRPRFVLLENVSALLVRGWVKFSSSWPRAGTMRNGSVYQRHPLVPTSTETGFSFWPTARAQARGASRNRVRERNHNYNIEDWIHILLVKAGWSETTGLKMNPEWLEWWMGFPHQWTSIEGQKDVETQSTPGSQNGSDSEL